MEQVGHWQGLSSGRRAELGRTGSVPLEGGLGGQLPAPATTAPCPWQLQNILDRKVDVCEIGGHASTGRHRPYAVGSKTTFRPLRHGARLSLLRPQLSPRNLQNLGQRAAACEEGCQGQRVPPPNPGPERRSPGLLSTCLPQCARPSILQEALGLCDRALFNQVTL